VEARVYRRRIKVIDNVFQYRTIAVLLVIVVCGVAAFTLGALVISALAQAREYSHQGLRLLAVFPYILVNDLVIMLMLIVAGVFLTHKIAGPVFRIQSDIDKVLAGERNVRVRFRRHDAFPELAEKVNKLIERIDDQPRR
jgi:nitrogen fixation/metabolism regulation signal transduction histidine kinase